MVNRTGPCLDFGAWSGLRLATIIRLYARLQLQEVNGRVDIYGLKRIPFLSRYNFFHEFHHILAWGVIVGLIEGNFASIVVAKTFEGSDFLITIASATPMALHIVSLVWGAYCVGRRKLKIFTFCTTGTVLALASVAMTPDVSYGGWLFVLQMAAAQFFQTGAVTVRSSLWKSNYPPLVRGQITARLQMARAVTRLVSVAIIATFFDLDPQSYRWIYPSAALIGAIGVVCLRRMRVRGEVGELRRLHGGERGDGALTGHASAQRILSSTHVLTSAISVLKHDTRFRNYCIAQMLAGVTNLLVRAVVVVILTQQVLAGMESGYWLNTVLLELLPMLLMLASMHASARYFDRTGVLRYRAVQMIGWLLAIFFGMCGTLAIGNMDWIGPRALLISVGCFAMFSIIRGICLGGGSIAWNLGHLHFVNNEDADVYMGIHVSLTGLRAMFIPILGMVLWNWIGWGVWLVSLVSGSLAICIFRMLELREREAPTRATSLIAVETLQKPTA
ncbi:MAG: hypothetical protein KDA54_18915 [Phycisphaerales bacterium]|nr:hypothetical protein [Phycisphaerales bacterium]